MSFKFRDEILNFLASEQRNYGLSEIVIQFPNHTPSSVRGTINLLVKKGTIERVGKALYAYTVVSALKEASEVL